MSVLPRAPTVLQDSTTKIRSQTQSQLASAVLQVVPATPSLRPRPQPAQFVAVGHIVHPRNLPPAPPASVESTTRTMSKPPASTVVRECFWTQPGHFHSTIVRVVPSARTRVILARPLAQTAHPAITRVALGRSSAPIARPGKPLRPQDKQRAPTARLGVTS